MTAPKASLDAMELAGIRPHEGTARMIGRPLVAQVLEDLLNDSIADDDATDVRVRIYDKLQEYRR